MQTKLSSCQIILYTSRNQSVDKFFIAFLAGKKKRKIRLDMHLEQMFLDSKDAYVWIYDPTPWYYWVGGGAIVLITIAVCLFPLWPPWMRLGVHYLSIAAAGFLVFIIALGVVKYIIFAILFALSAGKLRFWIFPNLTEDVGFFESFWPIYDYTYTGTIRSKVPFIYYVLKHLYSTKLNLASKFFTKTRFFFV